MTSWPLRIAGCTIPISLNGKRANARAACAVPPTRHTRMAEAGDGAERGACLSTRHKRCSTSGALILTAARSIEFELHLSLALRRQHPLSSADPKPLRCGCLTGVRRAPSIPKSAFAVHPHGQLPRALELVRGNRERTVLAALAVSSWRAMPVGGPSQRTAPTGDLQGQPCSTPPASGRVRS